MWYRIVICTCAPPLPQSVAQRKAKPMHSARRVPTHARTALDGLMFFCTLVRVVCVSLLPRFETLCTCRTVPHTEARRSLHRHSDARGNADTNSTSPCGRLQAGEVRVGPVVWATHCRRGNVRTRRTRRQRHARQDLLQQCRLGGAAPSARPHLAAAQRCALSAAQHTAPHRLAPTRASALSQHFPCEPLGMAAQRRHSCVRERGRR